MPVTVVRIRIELQPEGAYLATSDELPGFVVEAATLDRMMHWAPSIARTLYESYCDHGERPPSVYERQVDMVKGIEISIPVELTPASEPAIEYAI